MATAHTQTATLAQEGVPQESDQEVDELKKTATEQTNTLQAEAPELGMAGFWLQAAMGVGGLFIARHMADRAHVVASVARLKSKRYAFNLLHVKDRESFLHMGDALQTTKKETIRQQKKWEKNGFIEVGGLGSTKQRITKDEFARCQEAHKLASHVSGKINGEIITEKIKQTCAIYGKNLKNEESQKSLKEGMEKGMAKWLKAHPGSKIDDYLVTAGRQIARSHRELETKKEGKKVDKKALDKELASQQRWLAGWQTEKGRIPGLLEQTENRIINSRLSTLRAARKATATILDPKTPFTPLTPEQIQTILSGQYLSTQQPAASTPTQAVPAPVTISPPSAQPVPTPLPVSVTPPVVIPSRPIKPFVSSPKITLPKGLEAFFSKLNIVNNLVSKTVTKIGTSLISQGAKWAIKAAASTGIKKVLGQAVGSLLPGIGNAIMWLGGDTLLLKGVEIGAKAIAIVVILAVSIPLVFLLLSSSNSSSIFPVGFNDSVKFSLTDDKTLGFREFEKRYLTKEGGFKNEAWIQFEQEFLLSQQTRISNR